MEFSSYEDMKKFEAEREQFYLDFLDICHSFVPFRFKFYKRLFLESFHPKYRSQKKLYDGYYGGWWKRVEVMLTDYDHDGIDNYVTCKVETR